MHPSLSAGLTQLVRFEKHSAPNGYGEPTVTNVGPVPARFEANRTRVYTPEGDVVTLEGILFVNGTDLAVGMLDAGDVIVHPDGKRRAIRIIEPLYDLDGVLDHFEIQA